MPGRRLRPFPAQPPDPVAAGRLPEGDGPAAQVESAARTLPSGETAMLLAQWSFIQSCLPEAVSQQRSEWLSTAAKRRSPLGPKARQLA
jgi:hypothetical protein